MKKKFCRKILNLLVGCVVMVRIDDVIWTDYLFSVPDDDSYIVYNTVFSPSDVRTFVIEGCGRILITLKDV